MKINESFVWFTEEKNLDTSKIKEIVGYVNLAGCSYDFSSLLYIEGHVDLTGCSANLPSLESILGPVNFRCCSANLPSLKYIRGHIQLQGCSEEFKKSLAKTLRACGFINIEHRDRPLTLKEFKEMYGEVKPGEEYKDITIVTEL